jgi:hypothetical protein
MPVSDLFVTANAKFSGSSIRVTRCVREKSPILLPNPFFGRHSCKTYFVAKNSLRKRANSVWIAVFKNKKKLVKIRNHTIGENSVQSGHTAPADHLTFVHALT